MAAVLSPTIFWSLCEVGDQGDTNSHPLEHGHFFINLSIFLSIQTKETSVGY